MFVFGRYNLETVPESAIKKSRVGQTGQGRIILRCFCEVFVTGLASSANVFTVHFYQE